MLSAQYGEALHCTHPPRQAPRPSRLLCSPCRAGTETARSASHRRPPWDDGWERGGCVFSTSRPPRTRKGSGPDGRLARRRGSRAENGFPLRSQELIVKSHPRMSTVGTAASGQHCGTSCSQSRYYSLRQLCVGDGAQRVHRIVISLPQPLFLRPSSQPSRPLLSCP